MPEGPTIHRIARDQNEILAGKKLTLTSPQGRFESGARALNNRRLDHIEAVGKHLFYHFDGSRILHIHLGLYGKFRVQPAPGAAPRGAVRVRIASATHIVDLNGPNQCDVIDPTARTEILDRLGADPLAPNANPAKAWTRIHASKQSIGQLLMDQSVIAGIGNIYRAELLWDAKIHPRTLGSDLPKKTFHHIWKTAIAWMELAVDEGRIITTTRRAWKKPPAKLTRDERFNIYKHAHCPRCDAKVEQYPLAGRKVYACPSCQQVLPTFE
jgi:endonuclease-8